MMKKGIFYAALTLFLGVLLLAILFPGTTVGQITRTLKGDIIKLISGGQWDSTGLTLSGSIDLTHTAAENDDHAVELNVDAAGFGDAKALEIDYVTGAIGIGSDEAVILVNVDETSATGGDVVALEVLATEGSAKVIGLLVGVGIDPIEQLSGLFSDGDSIDEAGNDVLIPLSGGGAGDISVFENDNETITVGNTVKFEELEIIVDIGASGAGIQPKFEFSTGIGTWAEFSPVDGTNAFEHTGIMLWLDSDIPSWAVGTGSEYLIRITRQRNSLSTTPIIDKVQIAAAAEFFWDKNANVAVKSISSTTGNIADINAANNITAGAWLFGDAMRIEGGTSSRDYRAITAFPKQVADSGNVFESIQWDGRGGITIMWDDGNDSAIDIVALLFDGTSAERTPMNQAANSGSSAILVDVDDPGVAGFLTNGVAGTSLFRPGQWIKIGTNTQTRLMRVVDDDTIQIEDSQTWSIGDDIDIVIHGGFGIIVDSIGETNTGRVTSSFTKSCAATLKDDSGSTAANSAGGSVITISGGSFSMSATEQINYVGGMIRFCTDAGCTGDESARYAIASIGGATSITVSGTIPGAHSGVGFQLTSSATDDCMTSAEIAILSGDKHDILYHSIWQDGGYPRFGRLTDAEAINEVNTWLPVLEGIIGQRVNAMIYPANVATPGIMQVASRFFRGAFGIGISSGSAGNDPPIVTYNLARDASPDVPNLTLAAMQVDTDSCDTNKEWCVFFGHGVTSGMAVILGDWIDDTLLNHPDLVWVSPTEGLDVFGNRFEANGVSIGANGSIGRTDTIQGIATAGSSTTITLSDFASSKDQEYAGALIRIIAGTGVGQLIETIINYDGPTKVATVDSFSPAPDSTSEYRILQRRIIISGEFSDSVIRGNLDIKKSEDADPWEIFKIHGLTATGADDTDLVFELRGSAAAFPYKIFTNTDNGGRPLFIGADDPGVLGAYVEIGSHEATADSETTKLVTIVEGTQDDKAWFTRDGELGFNGLPTASLPTCNSTWQYHIIPDTTINKPVYCDGTAWIPMIP